MDRQTRKRNLKLKDHNKYYELKYFCRQYAEKKQELQKKYRNGDCMVDGITRLQKDIELIDNTLKEADPTIYEWLFKNVTEGIPYEWLEVPMGRRKFYETRAYFFYLLSKKK